MEIKEKRWYLIKHQLYPCFLYYLNYEYNNSCLFLIQKPLFDFRPGRLYRNYRLTNYTELKLLAQQFDYYFTCPTCIIAEVPGPHEI